MNIVVLDGFTLNPGDLCWEELERLGNVTIFDRTPSMEIIPRSSDADLLLTNKTPVTKQTMEQLPKLRYIGVLATGYNIVDIEAARERNIPVTNVPTYGTQSVAQMVFAHLLNFTQHVAHHAQTVRDGKWSRSADFCYWDYLMVELSGRTMGIVGLGRIGLSAARIALAFGMKVLAYDVSPQRTIKDGIEFTDVDTLFKDSDVISLHCPLAPETEKLVNKERLSLMKKSAFLINTSRGPLIDEAALAEALNNGEIGGAGLDVMSIEPPAEDHPLYQARNCYITPHIAWATLSARKRLMATVVDNIRSFLQGKPQNVVNFK